MGWGGYYGITLDVSQSVHTFVVADGRVVRRCPVPHGTGASN